MNLSLSAGACQCLTRLKPKVGRIRKRSTICTTGGPSPSPRRYSFSSHDVETFHVRCASSGLITLDIFNSEHLASPSRPLIIYLPPTGVHLRHTHLPIPAILHSYPLVAINYRWNHFSSPKKHTPRSPAFPAISDSHPFPTPLHDTLHAYTWLTTHYLPSLTSNSSPPPSNHEKDAYPTPPTTPHSRSPYDSSPRLRTAPRPLILYGSRLGGTLAASLALTECRDSKNVPFNIAGLILQDGIFDWTDVAISQPASDTPPVSPADDTAPILESLSTPWTLQTLHSLKHTLFSHQAYAFDRFASPTLFFRTPSATIPRTPYFPGCEPPPPSPAAVDLESLSLSEAQYAALRSAEFNNITPPTTSTGQENQAHSSSNGLQAEAVRSSDLRFPPRDSGLKIPRTLLLASSSPGGAGNSKRKLPSRAPSRSARNRASASAGSASGDVGGEADAGDDEPAAQAQEMARLMRRSVLLHEFKDRALWDEDADPHAASEERVQFVRLERDEDARAAAEREERILGEWLEGVGS